MTSRSTLGLGTLAIGIVLGSLVGCSDSSSDEQQLCSDTCLTPANGICDDGGPNALGATCQYGTDCSDCGVRSGSQAGPSPTGTVPPGTGGAPGTGGVAPATGGVAPTTGGAPATGGVAPTTGGAPATGGAPPVTGCGTGNPLLTPATGFIEDWDGSGIMGAWYTFGCQDAVITPAEGMAVAGGATGICFSGTVPQVIGEDYSTYYGAAIGFDICGAPEDPSFLPAPMSGWLPESKHTASECGISLNTISFNITGTFPADLRVVFKEPDRAESAFLVVNTGPGCFSGNVADANLSYTPGSPGPNVAGVEAIHFQVPTTPTASVAFDFCISDISIQ